MARDHLLYVSSQLPKRSETFVYREVRGLRERGVRVSVASVHAPERELGDPALDALAQEAVPIYGAGAAALLRDAVRQAASSPLTSLRVLTTAITDAATAQDLSLRQRPKVLWQSLAGLALAWRLRGRGISHLHAHMAHVPTTIAMYAAKALGIRFSFTGHAADLHRDRALLHRKLKRAAFVACISRWHRGFYQSLVHRQTENYPVIRCGVDTRAFHPAERKEVSPPRILAVGRLVPKKGFDVLIQAAGRLRQRSVPFVVTILGDGPELASLRARVSELGLHDHVELAGAASNAQVREAMATASLFVLPCRVDPAGDRDGIPVVLMEAMACGVPVIAGDLPPIRELIEHDQSGLIVPSDQPDELCEVMAAVIDDAALRDRLAAGGRQRVEEEFALDTTVDRLQSQFARLHSSTRAAEAARATARPLGSPLASHE